MNTLDIETVDGLVSPFPPAGQCPGFRRRSAGWIYRGWIAAGDGYEAATAAAGKRFSLDVYAWGAVCWEPVSRLKSKVQSRGLELAGAVAVALMLVGWVPARSLVVGPGQVVRVNRDLLVDGPILIGPGLGTFVLDAGTVQATYLKLVGDPASRVVINGGTLKVSFVSVTNHGPVVVGNGTDAAELDLAGGTSLISSLITVSSNAVLRGYGVVCGAVANYGTIVADGGVLLFTNGAGFSSMVTNWGVLIETNGGHLVFAGRAVNYARPEVVALSRSEAGWSVEFCSIGGLTNVLEATSDFRAPGWAMVEAFPGTGTRLVFTDSLPASRQFYRVRVEGRP